MQPVFVPVGIRGDVGPHPGDCMYVDRSAGRTAGCFGGVVVACAVLFSAVGCSVDAGYGVKVAGHLPVARIFTVVAGKAAGGRGDGTGEVSGACPVPSVPEPAVLAHVRVNMSDGETVGVGIPISVTFSRPVPAADREGVESWLRGQTSSGKRVAWSWVMGHSLLDGRRVDFRPDTAYWRSGTRVTLRLGSHGARHFAIGRSLVTTVDAKTYAKTYLITYVMTYVM
ncbi:Ig-like domain-containing protein, partial [Streptomyces sp. NPDC020362]|uniref:Ig-like domain-containing protein n=1 Tax=Streptomyces sp. NPDC020362 TaxID=3154486 RepID=UPI0033FBF19E